MARERTVKYPPKRGKLKRSGVKRAVEKVVYARRGNEKAEQTQGKKEIVMFQGHPMRVPPFCIKEQEGIT